MTHNTRKTICIPIQSHLNYLKLLGKSLINSENIRILFCSYTLDNDSKAKINTFFKSSSVAFYNYSENIDDNAIFSKIYDICIIRDFESHFHLIPFFTENVSGNGIVLLISREIQQNSKKEIIYNLSPFSKRLFHQLNAHTDIVTVATFDKQQQQHLQLSSLANGDHEQPTKIRNCNSPMDLCRSAEQKEALQLLLTSFEGTYSSSSTGKSLQSSVTIIEGLPGRGKSTTIALGLTAAIKFGLADIYVLGPHDIDLRKCCEHLRESLLSIGYLESDISIRRQEKYFILEVRCDSVIQKVRFISFQQEFTKYDTGLLCVLEVGRLPLAGINKVLSFNPRLVWVTVTSGGFHSTGSFTFHKVCRPLRAFCGIGQTLPNEVVETIGKTGSIVREICNKSDFKKLSTIFMNSPIIHGITDTLESSMNNIFCLQRKTEQKFDEKSGSNFYPEPNLCNLMYVNKTTLFSGHVAAEVLLEKFMNVYTSYEHKRNSDFLHQLCDEPSHHLFCLQQPTSQHLKYVPEILCIAHVTIEDLSAKDKPTIMGELSQNTSLEGLRVGKSIRIVRLVTQSKFKKLGYGRHMLKMLHRYFSETPSANESDHVLCNSVPAVHNSIELISLGELPKLLVDIAELPPAPFAINYMSCQFPADFDLLCFWKKCDFYPARIRAISSSQMLCTMIRTCAQSPLGNSEKLDEAAYREMCETIGPILLHDLRDVDVTLAHEILFHRNKFTMAGFKECSLDDIANCVDNRQLKKLDSFVQNVHTFESVQDIIHHVAQIYFGRRLSSLHLSKYQELALVGFGLQLKSGKQLATEMILAERYQNTNTIDPFHLRKDVQKRIPLLLSYIRECARVFLNHATKIIDDYDKSEMPEKKRRLM